MIKSLAILSASVSVLALSATAHAAPPPGANGVVVRHGAHPTTTGTPHNPLLKDRLANEDDDNQPEAPGFSAKCQRFITRPNPYGPIAPNVDMINHDNIAAAGSQAGCSTAQNETTIASNPTDPANIVAGANDYRVYNSREAGQDSTSFAYTSTDGGATWSDVLLPGLTYSTGAIGALRAMDGAGDPTVAFGKNNSVYFGSIAFSRGEPADGGTEAPSAIVVNVSRDGGQSFGPAKIIQVDGADAQGNFTSTRIFNDKIWITADPNSSYVYVTWTRFADTPSGGYAESPIVESVSADGGRTFSPFQRIDPPAGTTNPGLQPYSQGSNPQVGPDGTLYVAYETSYCATAACDGPRDRDVTVVATSTNHGRTFARSVVGTDYDFPVNEDGESVLTGEEFRLNSYPQLTVDRVTGQLLVTWVDDRNGSYDADGESVRTNGDNIVSSSTDGVTWTHPVAVGSSADEVFGAVASYDGTAAVASYTRHYQAGNVKLDFAYWPLTATPGQTVVAGGIRRVTTESSDPRIQFIGVDPDGHVVQGVFIGDYAAVSMGADKVLHPAWTDFRGNPGVTKPNQDAYVDSIPLG